MTTPRSGPAMRDGEALRRATQPGGPTMTLELH